MDSGNGSVMAEDSNTLPPAPEGMIAMEPPHGCGGYWVAPDPEGYLPADLFDEWLNRELPTELSSASGRFRTFYMRLILCEFHLTNRNGDPIPINDETAVSKQYPAQLSQMVFDATEPLISWVFNKKK
ncbi:MAG: hypothetical protein GY943_19385 [Chloroflexi bacterium]|nr:hypothetical protein [Chloroflexota bacterium]